MFIVRFKYVYFLNDSSTLRLSLCCLYIIRRLYSTSITMIRLSIQTSIGSNIVKLLFEALAP